MKIPTFQFPTDRITHLISPPEMPAEMLLMVLIVPSDTPEVLYVAIINERPRLWRFQRGPAAVRRDRVWHWLARIDPRWLKAPWSISDTPSHASNPDEIIERFARTGSCKKANPES